MENFGLERKLEEISGRRRKIEQEERAEIIRINAEVEKQKARVHNVAQEKKLQLAIEKDVLMEEYHEWKKRYLAEQAEQAEQE